MLSVHRRDALQAKSCHGAIAKLLHLDSSITGQHSVSRILTAKIGFALTRPGKERTHENRNHWSRQYWLARSQSRASLVGKIIVDPSNPIALDGKGGFKKIIRADQSSGQIIAGSPSEGA